MNALILDTETHDLHGYPIEIAHVPCTITDSVLKLDSDKVFDEYYSCPEPISFGAMSVHHILESDIANKPIYSTFRLPAGVEYIIGHNIDYDIAAIRRCDPSIEVKGICTLALARVLWGNAPDHKLGTLFYMLKGGTDEARTKLRNAHNAKADISFTAFILNRIVQMLKPKDLQSLYVFSEKARIPTKITFGKHSGTAIKDLPTDYRDWLLKQDNLDPYLRKALEA